MNRVELYKKKRKGEVRMRVGIMQPYFFPYLGYFSLINYVDNFIFFDTPQYIRHGWINRNKIMKHNGEAGGQYITVPIQKTSQKTAIKNIFITKNIDWKSKIYGQLTVYKRKAPHYNDVLEFLHSVLDQGYNNNLSNLNIETTKAICTYIGIKKKFDIYSQMDLGITNVNEADEWALNITKAVNGNVYVNPPGGRNFFNKEKYLREQIKLEFLQSKLPRYNQKTETFEAGLSIIDMLMFCTKNEIIDMLQEIIIFK